MIRDHSNVRQYDAIRDHSNDWDLLGVPTYAPLVELKKRRKIINTFSATFLATRNWQDRLVTVFGPMLFTVFATIVNCEWRWKRMM
jgi:hypothetical protein